MSEHHPERRDSEQVSDVAQCATAREQLFGDRADIAIAYADLLCSTGVDHGLIGPREVERIWSRHILNCAVVAECIPHGATLVDVGSGAGLPGLALAIARPDVNVTLVEPMERRVNWLESTIRQLGVDVTVWRGRAEEFHGKATFDVATARAVTRLELLLRWCMPLVRSGGELVALKGKSAQQEIDAAAKWIRKYAAAQPTLFSCGSAILEIPTTVVRVVAR